jgi:hypothetical protein
MLVVEIVECAGVGHKHVGVAEIELRTVIDAFAVPVGQAASHDDLQSMRHAYARDAIETCLRGSISTASVPTSEKPG